MTLILSLETSTATCSVAIGEAGELRAFSQSDGNDYSHASEITKLIGHAMEKAEVTWSDLKAVAVSTGPGSFTGLRVGASAAKGICFAHDLPLIGVSTLKTMAHEVYRSDAITEQCYIPMIHARKEEYYLAVYDNNLLEITAPQVFDLAQGDLLSLSDQSSEIILIGEGLEKLLSTYASIGVKNVEPNAAMICPVAALHYKSQQFIDWESYTPTYLKDPHITIAKKRI